MKSARMARIIGLGIALPLLAVWLSSTTVSLEGATTAKTAKVKKVKAAKVKKGTAPVGGTVLILGPTVVPHSDPLISVSVEQTEAEALGFDVDVKTAAEWGGLTASDFEQYRAIILGDANCSVDLSLLNGAVASQSVWGPVVNGVGSNVVINGTDLTFPFHFDPGILRGERLISNSIKFAAGGTTTGAFISLSCYYALELKADPPVYRTQFFGHRLTLRRPA